MKNFFLIILTIFSIAFLVFGYVHYQHRTAVSPLASAVEAEGTSDALQENSSQETEPETTSKHYSDLIANWPEEGKAHFISKTMSNEPFKMAVVGSSALGAEDGGWSEQLKTNLQEAYGDLLEVELFEYDTTSIEFINSSQSEEVLDFAPDLILYEPFSLNDNSGAVAPSDNHDSIDIFLSNLQAANEEAALILQPTHPIFGATYYPIQVGELQAFAESSSIPYLDHWTAWPALEDEELKDYVNSSQDEPNEKGHEIWADFLTSYFIAE
ncbi:SGNH/GDSL hydrolase family protein [Bacillus sp. P14.5]|uniref:SGNH/GDSL hydrolase family protein n=1 Tax=Bacillus sp. P14.5 TaxID=1983400 RepID=UPI000DEB3A0C|nr:SGNH/GDSL hydrolase family protein [Bacillus sp. P14.5]